MIEIKAESQGKKEGVAVKMAVKGTKGELMAECVSVIEALKSVDDGALFAAALLVSFQRTTRTRRTTDVK